MRYLCADALACVNLECVVSQDVKLWKQFYKLYKRKTELVYLDKQRKYQVPMMMSSIKSVHLKPKRFKKLTKSALSR